MFGRMPARTKLDDERKRAILAALTLFEGDMQTILLAVEGMAAADLGHLPDTQQDAMRELSWFLASAKRIESALRWSDKLQSQLQQSAAASGARAAQESAPVTPECAAAASAAREKLRALAAQGRKGEWRHG
jgi:hypothetical protein